MTLGGIVYILIDDIVRIAQTYPGSIHILHIIGKPKDEPYEKNNYSTKTS